jgi:hypothetical protein
MQPPFAQVETPSPSPVGMERPVRSFKSFIRTVPPNPTATQKPLPLTPSPILDFPFSQRNSTPSPPASLTGSSGATSWKPPADWYESLVTPPIPSRRILSPLLPELSPAARAMEQNSSLSNSPPPSAQLWSIHELPNENTNLGPPRSPPRSPLPTPPTSARKLNEAHLFLNREGDNDSPSAINKYFLDTNLRHNTPSPANSVHTSITSDASTKEKAFASLGIDSPTQQTAIPGDGPYGAESILSVKSPRTDRRYLRGKRLRVLNKGSPLVDDNWEDTEMDEKTRQLSFSQDYHDLLADQYQETHIRAEEVAGSRGIYQVHKAQYDEPKSTLPLKDYELVPRPLSWNKGSGNSVPRLPSRNPSRNYSQNSSRNTTPDTYMEPSSDLLQGKVHKRIASWVPHRLSVASRRQSLPHEIDDSFRQKPKPLAQRKLSEPVPSKVTRDDLRFSRFFPSSKPLNFGRKNKQAKHPEGAKTPFQFTPRKSSTPLLRLPGGLAVVRHSRSPVAKFDAASVKFPSPVSDHAPGGYKPTSQYSPLSNLDNRSSFHSRSSHSPAVSDIPVRNNSRTSRVSAYSHHYGNSSPIHPLSREATRGTFMTPIPPPPPHPSLSPFTPPLSPEAWKRFNPPSEYEDRHLKSGLIEKAKQARRKHSRDVRQERLKKSIRVVGPTDPGVLPGHIREEVPVNFDGEPRRLPGYMVGGRI